jgi:hypothetical protein
MNTREKIEDSVIANLPIWFAGDLEADKHTFQEVYNRFLDYASSASGAYLGTETVRYQSMLLYSSLLLATVQFFNFDQITLFEKKISVGPQALLIYTLFMWAIATIFIIKSIIDGTRVKFTEEKNLPALVELIKTTNIALFKRQLQQYFAMNIFSTIESAARERHSAFQAGGKASDSNTEGPKAEDPYVKMRFDINLRELSKFPDLATEISRLEAFVSDFKQALYNDIEECRRQKSALLAKYANKSKTNSPEESTSEDILDQEIDEMRCESEIAAILNKWIIARANLSLKQCAQESHESNSGVPNRISVKSTQVHQTRVFYARGPNALFICGLGNILCLVEALIGKAFLLSKYSASRLTSLNIFNTSSTTARTYLSARSAHGIF